VKARRQEGKMTKKRNRKRKCKRQRKRKRQDKRRQHKTKVQGVEIKRRELRAFFFNALSSCLVLSCLFSQAKRYKTKRRPCGKATETL
jgi:hypothetical protein